MVQQNVQKTVLKMNKSVYLNKYKIEIIVIHGYHLDLDIVVERVTRQKVFEIFSLFSIVHCFFLLVESRCGVEILGEEFLHVDNCVSFTCVSRERCTGGCESQASNTLTMANSVHHLGNSICQCCAPKDTYKEEISMNCKSSGNTGYVIKAIYTHILSCDCQVCKG
jgi:hypothetical protein